MINVRHWELPRLGGVDSISGSAKTCQFRHQKSDAEIFDKSDSALKYGIVLWMSSSAWKDPILFRAFPSSRFPAHVALKLICPRDGPGSLNLIHTPSRPYA